MLMTLLIPLLPYLFLTASLVLLLGLLYGMNQRIRKLRAQVGKCEARLQAETAQFVNLLASLKLRIEELEAQPPAAVSTVATAGLNSTVRSKVLKMHQLGQAPGKISETLQVPQGEVDLLVKVHRIVMRPYEGVVKPVEKT
jgi:hypothetical protein